LHTTSSFYKKVNRYYKHSRILEKKHRLSNCKTKNNLDRKALFHSVPTTSSTVHNSNKDIVRFFKKMVKKTGIKKGAASMYGPAPFLKTILPRR